MNRIPANKLSVAINSVARMGGKFGAMLHEVAYSCLALIDENGDVRPLQRLYDTIGGVAVKAALAAWAKAYGKVSVSYAEDDAEKTRPVFKFAKGGESDLAAAEAVPVLDYKPESSGKAAEFDFAAKISALLKAAEKAGAHLKHVKAYQLLTEAETVAKGENVKPVRSTGRKTKPEAEKIAA